MENQKKLEIIQVVRFFSALCIILYHSTFISDHGYFGVEIFCMISGFIMMYSTQSEKSKTHFLMKRFFRVLPLYWIMTIFTYVIICFLPQLSIMSEAKPEYLIKSMFFIPFENSKGYNTPILSVGWTLNYEMMFYLIFFLAIHISHKYRGLITLSIILVLVGIGQLIHPTSIILGYYTDSFLIEFALGIIAFYILEFIRIHCPNISKLNAILVIISILTFTWMMLDITNGSAVPRCIRIGLPALLFLCSITTCFRNTHFPNSLVELGNMSYSIYLIEYFSTAVFKVLAPRFSMPIQFLLLIITILLTIGCSYISYQLIEIRFTNLLKKTFFKK